MALDPNINTLEKGKFREAADGNTSVSVVSDETSDVKLYDTGTTDIIYIGVAAKASLTSAPDWQITKIDSTTSIISSKKSLANQIWDDRAALTYE